MVIARLRSCSAFFSAFLVAALITGCSNQRPLRSPVLAMTRHGSVHGGQQPVSGATIQLYAVGTAGDGSAATTLLSSATISGTDGSFDITGKYSCPTGASLVYIVASGGNPGLASGTNNSALDMMSALGPCDSLTASTFIIINEVTTVAAVSALSPFMTSLSAVGSATNDAAALANAFALASVFVNTSTGTSPGPNVPAGTVVPIAKINSLANVVTSCVNSSGGTANDGSVCGTLFTLTTVQGQQPPTNIITALNNVASNPALNTTALFNLAPSAAPYQPTLTAPPADFSIRLTSTGGTGPSGPVTLSPTTLNFYQTNVPQTITMTNAGLTPVVIQSITISPSNWSQTNDCGTVLQAQSICTITVQSTNSALGTFSGTLTVVDDDTNDAQTVQLSTDNETLADTIVYGSWPIGTTAPNLQPLFVTGGVPISTTISNRVLTGNLTGRASGDFTIYDQLSGILTSPFRCDHGPGGPDCFLYTLFTPSDVGTRSSLLVTNIGTYLLTGTGLPHGSRFSFDSTSYDFGLASPGIPVPLPLTIASTGDAQVTLLPPAIGGANASDFSVTSPCGRNVLQPVTSASVSMHVSSYVQTGGAPDSCTFTVAFTPSSSGPRTATLTQADSLGFSQTVTLVGNSISNPPVTLSPTALTFYQTNVPQTVTMTNSGLTPVAIQSINISSSNWWQTNDCGTVLQAQSVCTINVQSTNSALGTFSGTLTVVDNDTNDVQVVQLNTDNEVLTGTIDYGSWPIGSTGPYPISFRIQVGAYDPQTNISTLTGNLTGPNPGDFPVYDQNAGKLSSPSFTCSEPSGVGTVSGCSLTILFKPSALGPRSSLFVTNDGTYLLTGTGLPRGPFSYSAARYDFASAALGTPNFLGLTLTSTGDAQVTLLPPVIGGPNASDFTATPCSKNVLQPVTSAYMHVDNYVYGQVGGTIDSCTLGVTFTPSSSGPRIATLTQSDTLGFSRTVTLVGNTTSNPPPTANPTSLSFGNVQIGQNTIQTVTVSSPNRPAITAQILGSTDYSVQPTACAQGSASCTFNITFAPSSIGAIAGTLSLNGQGSLTNTSVPLTGTGIQPQPAVSLSSTNLSFGTYNVGTTSISQTITLTNTGASPLHISNVAVTTAQPGEFVASGSCPTSSVVAVGQTCTVSVSFAPQTTGTRTGTLQISSDALTSPDTIQLTGIAQ